MRCVFPLRAPLRRRHDWTNKSHPAMPLSMHQPPPQPRCIIINCSDMSCTHKHEGTKHTSMTSGIMRVYVSILTDLTALADWLIERFRFLRFSLSLSRENWSHFRLKILKHELNFRDHVRLFARKFQPRFAHCRLIALLQSIELTL